MVVVHTYDFYKDYVDHRIGFSVRKHLVKQANSGLVKRGKHFFAQKKVNMYLTNGKKKHRFVTRFHMWAGGKLDD